MIVYYIDYFNKGGDKRMELKIKFSKYLEELSEELQDMVLSVLDNNKTITDGYYTVYCDWDNYIWVSNGYSKFMVM